MNTGLIKSLAGNEMMRWDFSDIMIDGRAAVLFQLENLYFSPDSQSYDGFMEYVGLRHTWQNGKLLYDRSINCTALYDEIVAMNPQHTYDKIKLPSGEMTICDDDFEMRLRPITGEYKSPPLGINGGRYRAKTIANGYWAMLGIYMDIYDFMRENPTAVAVDAYAVMRGAIPARIARLQTAAGRMDEIQRMFNYSFSCKNFIKKHQHIW